MSRRSVTTSALVSFLSISACVAVLLWCISTAAAAPKPAAVSKSWQLDFKFKDPQRITLQLPGHQKPETFWYVVYTVTNNTGQDVVFHGEFALMTDTMQVVRANLGVDPVVFAEIRKLYKPTYPWLEDPVKIIGKVLQGQDNARDSIAVWPAFDPKASGFTVFVGGLSGEATSVPNPLYRPGRSDNQKTPPRFVLCKTLMVEYSIPGEPATKTRAKPFRSGRPQVQWVMR